MFCERWFLVYLVYWYFPIIFVVYFGRIEGLWVRCSGVPWVCFMIIERDCYGGVLLWIVCLSSLFLSRLLRFINVDAMAF